MRIQEKLLFQRNLGNSFSRSLYKTARGQWKRDKQIECLLPSQKRHHISCPQMQGPTKAWLLHGTSFTNLRSCLNWSAHQIAGLALEKSRNSRTVWMTQEGEQNKTGNSGNSNFLRTIVAVTQRFFNTWAIAYAWYMAPHSCSSTSFTLTAPGISGTLPSSFPGAVNSPSHPPITSWNLSQELKAEGPDTSCQAAQVCSKEVQSPAKKVKWAGIRRAQKHDHSLVVQGLSPI